ncbi:unnamed protein product [Caenorhabditis nigoni]
MNNQPVLYDSLKTILHHMDATLRINISTRIPSIRAVEKAVPLKLGVCRDNPNGDISPSIRYENARGGVETDFDRFGFKIPIGSNPILPGDVSVGNTDEQVVRTDTDELEERYQTELTRCENIQQIIAEIESGKRAWTSEYQRYNKKNLQYMANDAREKLKPFHCRRHNLPRPFNCYIQLSVMKDGEAAPLQRLAYTRKLYEVVKEFNHILFENRPVIRVNELVCLANQVYRIPVRMKIRANESTTRQCQIGSIATMLEGDMNTFRVFRGSNAENWWQHRLVQNARKLITGDFFEPEKSCLMLKTFRNKIIRFHNLIILTTERYWEMIESWMSVKREVGSELWIGILQELSNDVLEMMQTRMEVIRRDERCVTIHDKNGTRVEVSEEVCEDESMVHNWALKVKIIEN